MKETFPIKKTSDANDQSIYKFESTRGEVNEQ